MADRLDKKIYLVPSMFEEIDVDRIDAALEQKSIEKDIVIYGAGYNGRILCDYLETKGHRVLFFCDKDHEKQGTRCCGKEIVSSAELSGKQKSVFIIISINGPGEEITAGLVLLGIPEASILALSFAPRVYNLRIPSSLMPTCETGTFRLEDWYPPQQRTIVPKNRVPKITVAITTYNIHEDYLRRAMESILNQTFVDFQVVAYDNGTTDGTNRLLREYAARDSRIIIERSETNYMNMERSQKIEQKLTLYEHIKKTPYCCRLDSDDYYFPSFLERTYEAAIQYGADFVTVKSIGYLDSDPCSNWILPSHFGTLVRKSKEKLITLLCRYNEIWSVWWAKLMRTERLLNRFFSFPPEVVGAINDTILIHEEMLSSAMVVMLDSPLHCATARLGSKIRTIDARAAFFRRDFFLYDWFLKTLSQSDEIMTENIAFVQHMVARRMRGELDFINRELENSHDTALVDEVRLILKTAMEDSAFPRMKQVSLFAPLLAELENLYKELGL